MSSNRIEKRIELRAPLTRVWLAITDHRQFGEWFRVSLQGPFVQGETSKGHITWPGYEHLTWTALVTAIEPETYFAFQWHPYALDTTKDYSVETPTLVEFRLQETATGTALTVTESGFDKLPPSRRDEAFRMNDRGWEQQMQNIEAHVSEIE